MQSQVDEAEPELAHLRVGGAEIARADHAVVEAVRNGSAGLIMTGEQIERLAFPGPVFHDLRGQLDEVPGHVGAGEAAHLDAAEAMMQKMPELVEDGLHFAMS